MKAQKQKIVQLWHYVLDDTNCVPCEGGTLIPMCGFTRRADFYLCVPKLGFYHRCGNCGRYRRNFYRYGNECWEYFYNGRFIGGGSSYKCDKIKKLCEAGYENEAYEYVNNYRYWRETTLGGRHIIARKERARISHELCSVGGALGHELRQEIRRDLRFTSSVTCSY